ncbi:hypothetical protein MAR_018824, partial [Mya arenaria]
LTNCGIDKPTCVGNSGFTGSTCTCSTEYTEKSSLCVGAIDQSCDTNADCDTSADLVCDMASTTKTCKKVTSSSVAAVLSSLLLAFCLLISAV